MIRRLLTILLILASSLTCLGGNHSSHTVRIATDAGRMKVKVLEDCYAALKWMYDNAAELGIDPERIIVGGESAGGGLTAAVCLYARDKGEVPVALQLPLYPMLDSEDTASSADNHGKVWNTKRNH